MWGRGKSARGGGGLGVVGGGFRGGLEGGCHGACQGETCVGKEVRADVEGGGGPCQTLMCVVLSAFTFCIVLVSLFVSGAWGSAGALVCTGTGVGEARAGGPWSGAVVRGVCGLRGVLSLVLGNLILSLVSCGVIWVLRGGINPADRLGDAGIA
jgi:hypothetical protein